MTHQAKKFLMASGNITVGNQATSAETFTENVNVHGLRVDLEMTTDTANEIAAVNWALLCLPELITVTPTIDDTGITNESMQEVIWASGKCLVTNQQTTLCTIEPKTSRTCPPGTRLILVVRAETDLLGVSNVVFTISMRWWETQV